MFGERLQKIGILDTIFNEKKNKKNAEFQLKTLPKTVGLNYSSTLFCL